MRGCGSAAAAIPARQAGDDQQQPCNGGGGSAAAGPGLADVLGLVASYAAAHLGCSEHQALRLVCRDVYQAHDAASQLQGLTINADRWHRLSDGEEGAQQLARFFGRPGRSLPSALTIRSYGDYARFTAELRAQKL